MFDNDDVSQEVAMAGLRGQTVGRGRMQRRLYERSRHQARRRVFQATPEQLTTIIDHRHSTVLTDLEGLPAMTLQVAHLLSHGARFGDVMSTLGIGRRELDAHRKTLREALS